jgi:hypothetical protein
MGMFGLNIRALGLSPRGTATSCDRKRDQSADGHHQHALDAYQRASSRLYPVENRSRALNAEKRGRKSRNDHSGPQRTEGPRRTRVPRDQHQDEPDTDSNNSDHEEPDRRHDGPPKRHQAVWREETSHADHDDEESDEQGERFHLERTRYRITQHGQPGARRKKPRTVSLLQFPSLGFSRRERNLQASRGVSVQLDPKARRALLVRVGLRGRRGGSGPRVL